LNARRHVNRLCTSLNKIFIESGTQGYIGQTFTIIPKKTECFECSPKELTKKFPICTLRSYPTRSVHSIEWAKSLFGLLFGPPDESNFLNDFVFKKKNFEESLFNQIFYDEVKTQIYMNKFEAKSNIPIPLKWEKVILKQELPVIYDDQNVLTLKQNVKTFLQITRQLMSNPSLGDLHLDKNFNLSMRFISATTNIRNYQFHIGLKRFIINNLIN